MIRYSFPNKVALVTGSSRGIGAEVLRGFAAGGATCIVHYFADPDGLNAKDADALATQLHGLPGSPSIHTFAADVRDAAQMEGLMARVKETCGGLDILVNNAGVLRDRTLKKMSRDEWSAVIDTNLTGVFHGCKFGADVMRDGGRIVNVASVAGLVGFHGQANYAAAKAGVIGLTRAVAKELARRQITVNAVAPGVVQTAMLGEIKPEVMAEYIKQIPVGRLAQPSDVANVIHFLASDETAYVTGQVIPVTGGWLV